MTQVTITNKQQEPKLVKITEAEAGKWYKVHSYLYGTNFNDEIGVILPDVHLKGTTQGYNILVTTSGFKLYNPDFILQELTEVQITYN